MSASPTWGAATWDPKSRIHVDPASGEYVIDVDFFTAVMGDFTVFEADETVLRQNKSGAYFIAYVGELAEALGLELVVVVVVPASSFPPSSQ